MLTYNNKMIYSSTGMIPKETRKKENEVKAKLNVASKPKKERIYPELKVGDEVKNYEENMIPEKEQTSHSLKGEYVVESISEKLNQTYYKLTDYPRPLLRHELLKV